MKQHKRNIPLTSYILFSLVVLLAGCQPAVYLMPPPVGLNTDNDFFTLSNFSKNTNLLTTLYATNRIPEPLTANNRRYTIFPSNNLRLGVVTHRVGDDVESWEDFYKKSLNRERKEDLPILLHHVQEWLTIDAGQTHDGANWENRAVFKRLNTVLTKTADKDITIYVHGANSNFYRGTAQGAQYFHFTGHNSVVLTFCWPSAENIFRYKTDIVHAKRTVQSFTRLLQLLAENTSARNINILSYSAGAQIVIPALVTLRENLSDLPLQTIKERYRIGEIYLAAPDTELRPFALQLEQFEGIIDRITISINTIDSVLLHAQRFTGQPRLGRPAPVDIPKKEKEIVFSASRTGVLDIIDIKGSYSLKAGSSHSFWYNHPWVSNDVLFLMLLKLPPAERGLTRSVHETGMVLWHFPDDYTAKINDLVQNLNQINNRDSTQ